MKIIPAKGQAFVIEDSEDFSAFAKAGLQIPDEAKRGVGTTGVVYAIEKFDGAVIGNTIIPPVQFKVGDRVIFDKFIAQDIYIRDESGKEVERLRCLPIDCILGTIE